MTNKILHTELSLNKQNSLFSFAYVLFWNLFDARVFNSEKQNYPVEPRTVTLIDSITKYAYDYHQSISMNTTVKRVVMHRNNTAILAEGCVDFHKGYDYFGARYYDSDISVWLSCDPLASKYPGISSYNYCFYNPIMFKDLWGLEGEGVGEGKVKIRKVRSDREGREKFKYRNKTTGENGWIYTDKGKKTKDVKQDMRDKNFANYDIESYDKNRKHIRTENYGCDGTIIPIIDYGTLSGIEIVGQRPAITTKSGSGIGFTYTEMRVNSNEANKFFKEYSKFNNYRYFGEGSGAIMSGIKNTPVGTALSTIVLLESFLANATLMSIEEKWNNLPNPKGLIITVYNYYSNGYKAMSINISEASTGKSLGVLR